MITALNLFGRPAETANERKALRCANKAAKTLYKKRFSPGLAKNWDKPVNEVALEDVEKDVIQAILSKYDYGRQHETA